MEWLSLLWGTMVLRPYVLLFLAAYLAIAIPNIGVLRTLVFTLTSFIIAFSAEYSSTRNGFPFGYYSYIETTRGRELWISNVPFMDSLSYSFLAYVSYTMSVLIWSPLKRNVWDIRTDWDSVKGSLRVILTGAALFMMMDVIIDPVAFLGDRWFLGKIYTYREEGEYFNIPLTNFGGWFIVGTAILFTFSKLDRWLDLRRPFISNNVPCMALLGPGLYFGVLAFNLAVTFYIGEILMGFCGMAITAAILALVMYKIRNPEAFRI